MEKEFTKEDCIRYKKSGIRSINQLLENYIASNDPKLYKKTVLISKWLKEYSNFINFESRFSATRNIAYKRGDIVFVNLGFNIGAELGGVHYAVVLDKENPHNAANITIVPLSSLKTDPAKVHHRDCYLGNEFYQKLISKINTLSEKIQEQLNELQELQDSITYLTDVYTNTSPEDLLNEECIMVHRKAPRELQTLQQVLARKQKEYSSDLLLLSRQQEALSYMKPGSIAKIDQITTISKMRILNPKSTTDTLSGIKISSENMDKINDKLKKLFYLLINIY